MEGRRVSRRKPRRNPLYVLFMGLLALSLVLLITVVVLGFKLKSARSDLAAAQTKIEQLHIAATYNVVNGDPAAFVQSGLGYLLTTDNHLPKQLDPGLCFRPLSPTLELRHALVWKRYAVFSKATELFLQTFEK